MNKKILGIGDASGMFPIKDSGYDREKLASYDELLKKHGKNAYYGQ